MSDEPIKEERKEPETIELWNMAFFKTKWWKPWYTFFYVDCPQYLSFNIFDKYGVKPFWMRFYESDNVKYIGIICCVRKKHMDDFLMSMHELQKNMAICGYTDYEEFCHEVQEAMDEADADE